MVTYFGSNGFFFPEYNRIKSIKVRAGERICSVLFRLVQRIDILTNRYKYL